MNNSSAPKSVGREEKRDERGRRMPVRIHELLGVTQSAGKIKNADGLMVEKQKSQPVRIKDLLASMSSSKKPIASARRMTTLPSVTSNARRQLYEETSDRLSPDKTFSTNTTLQSSANKTVSVPNGNAGGRIKSMPVQHLGISRSEGKNMKINGQRHQPEKEKDSMASWEKSQTVKQQARKSIMGDLQVKNVRRKLYNNAPSPAVAQKISRKSLAPHKIQTQTVKAATAQRKSLKPEPKKSQSRKSSLLPPNSIRDKHMNRLQNSTIKEESPTSLLNDVATSKKSISENSKNSSEIVEDTKNSSEIVEDTKNSSEIVEDAKNLLEETFDLEKTSKTSKDRLSSTNHSREDDLCKNDEKSWIECSAPVSRPTVIITAMSEKKIHPKSQSPSPGSSDSKKSSFTMSRPALQDSKRNSSLMQQRLDAMTSSFEDLLGESRFERGESFRTSNLPFNSFLDEIPTANKSLASVDQQTLAWMHANLSVTIRSTEENLFSMKQMLRTLEELRDKNSLRDETEMKNCEENIVGETETKNRDKKPEKIVDKKIADENYGRSPPKIIIQRENSVPAKSKNIEERDEKVVEERKDDNENKENIIENEKVEKSGRRRSARLAALEAKESPIKSDDSFSMIERQLNIFHEKSTNPPTPRVATPRVRKKVDPRSRRSVREYMALKSMTNFLQTPDVKGLPTPKCEKDTPSHRFATKRSLSRQLLIELDDLYAESPQ